MIPGDINLAVFQAIRHELRLVLDSLESSISLLPRAERSHWSPKLQEITDRCKKDLRTANALCDRLASHEPARQQFAADREPRNPEYSQSSALNVYVEAVLAHQAHAFYHLLERTAREVLSLGNTMTESKRSAAITRIASHLRDSAAMIESSHMRETLTPIDLFEFASEVAARVLGPEYVHRDPGTGQQKRCRISTNTRKLSGALVMLFGVVRSATTPEAAIVKLSVAGNDGPNFGSFISLTFAGSPPPLPLASRGTPSLPPNAGSDVIDMTLATRLFQECRAEVNVAPGENEHTILIRFSEEAVADYWTRTI